MPNGYLTLPLNTEHISEIKAEDVGFDLSDIIEDGVEEDLEEDLN